MQKIYALVDCNNFFVSCERAFQPKLRNLPVAVLSSNDGCVISRSEEVKKMGLPMGAPYFKYADLIKKNGVKIFSSNFELYSDMSDRVMSVLARFSDGLEIYSVDEAFLNLDGMKNAEEYARKIRATILQWVGIPVSIGLAPSKTLAKAASHIAKKNRETGGVFDFSPLPNREILKDFPVSEIWGIGRSHTEFLESKNIKTAWQLINAEAGWIKKSLSIQGSRIVQELQGISCDSGWNEPEEAKKSIVCSRSFSNAVDNLKDLQEAVALHAAHAAEKLREEKEVASRIGVYLRCGSSRGAYKESFFREIDVDPATNFTPAVSAAALRILQSIFKPGLKYKKAGVTCRALSGSESIQQTLFGAHDFEKEHRLMGAYDYLNGRFGSNTLFYAQTGIKRSWKPKREMLSKAFTTNFEQIPEVRALA